MLQCLEVLDFYVFMVINVLVKYQKITNFIIILVLLLKPVRKWLSFNLGFADGICKVHDFLEEVRLLVFC